MVNLKVGNQKRNAEHRLEFLGDSANFKTKLVKKMSNLQTYAVVDLEMTGTNPNGSERLIQFSCVFTEGNKIVNTFSTLINPLKKIPEDVQNLTNITDKDVKNAPTFDEVAGTIYALLSDTVFVAHNIELDYRFLNSEFERIGFPKLDLEGIDTVQLAQIAFPTLASYRLGDLAHFLGFKHKHPHHADSDAFVTAELFILLQKKLASMPEALLKSLLKLSDALLYETKQCILQAYENKRKQYEMLDKEHIEVDGIVLRRPRFEVKKGFNDKFPKTEAEQSRLFSGVIDWRKEQAKMMNDIYEHFNDDEKMLLVQAPTGMGKTLGYLVPGAYQAQEGASTVVSTSTTALLDQIVKESVPLLKKIVPFDFTYEVMKGSGHYIDLEKFSHTLKIPMNNQTRLLQMRILSWLWQTTTGDMDELRLTTYRAQLFKMIKHAGVGSLSDKSAFYGLDFVRLRDVRVKFADFVFTNHSYLVRHAEEIGKKKANLILDEAQNIPSVAMEQGGSVFDFDLVKIYSDTLLVSMESRISFSFEGLIRQHFLTKNEYRTILRNIQIIDHSVPFIREKFWERYVRTKGGSKKEFVETLLSPNKVLGLLKENFAIFLKTTKAYTELLGQMTEMKQRFFRALDAGTLDHEAVNLLTDWFIDCEKLVESMEKWHLLEFSELEKMDETTLVWMKHSPNNPKTHLRLCFSRLEAGKYLEERVYGYFKHIVMCGALLFTKKTEDYTKDQLRLDDDVLTKRYQSAFDYAHQASAVFATDSPDLSSMLSKAEYHAYLTDALAGIIEKTSLQTLVLFNSLEDIEAVYNGLSIRGLNKKREILAQGVNGTPEKLKKRFVLTSSKSILLGAGSFWEGIDLPEEKLELLVITRLPFQSPDSLINKVRYRNVQAKGHNPFSAVSLPEAALKFRQGFGRLIRTKDDHGILAVLDSRIVNKRYAHEFTDTLPKDLRIDRVEMKDIPEIICDTEKDFGF